MNPGPRLRLSRDGWLAAAAALIMIPALALSAAPPGLAQAVALGAIVLGMLLALAFG
ncbi:MAG TPA: hypothetical protein VLD63_11710 [Anaerolineales bacterium]|nr:hypothetical protein [Anaerolineales bacterium]